MSFPFDPIKFPNCARGHNYALDVVEGKITAGIYLIGACKRYLEDLKNKDAEWYFKPEAAERYLRLVQNFDHTIGKWKTKKIIYEPWQCWVWMCIMGFLNKETAFRRFRIAHVEIGRGNGKALCLNTDVPTPDRGLVKFGDLAVGDLLYGSDGKICRVIGKNEVHQPKAFRVSFSDGTTVDCSSNHLWTTSTKNERRKKKNSIKTAEEIFRTLKHGKETNHSIPVCVPVEGSRSDAQLPYVLGYWLGNGDSNQGRFTAHSDYYEEIVSRFKSRSLEVKIKSTKGNAARFTVPALTYWLKEIQVLNNKHIPEKYFMADEAARRELLRGLMDSDGTISKSIGNFIFCNANLRLAKDTRRLIASLGYKATITEKKTKCQGGYEGVAYYVTFSTPNTRPAVFGIRAKEDKRITRPTYYAGKRYITNVEPIESKDMFCIEVDSSDNTFLITDQYIPTHNSPMASQCALYLLALDDPNGNQISTVATKKDQARIVLDASRVMASKNDSFRRKTGVKVLAHSIIHPSSNSIMRALSSEHSSLDGLNDILAVCDELHAMRRDTFETVYSGMSKRSDSLTLCITTAGSDTEGIGASQSAYAKKVCLGEMEDDQFFAVVYTIDENDKWDDESVWIKANPNFGVSVDEKSFRAKIKKAQEIPADVANIKIKHLNVWLNEANAYYDQAQWDLCADPSLKMEDFRGYPCWGGLDLASTVDICSTGYIFWREDILYVFDRSFLPEETLRTNKKTKKNSTLYENCAGSGHLIITPGAAINNDFIREDILKQRGSHRIQGMLYDSWNATEMAQKLSSKIEMIKVAKNVANFSEPMKKLQGMIAGRKLRHNGSPLLRWTLGNVVAKEDHNQNVYPRKSHPELKIDPIVTILMALAGYLQEDVKESVYETRGIRSV